MSANLGADFGAGSATAGAGPSRRLRERRATLRLGSCDATAPRRAQRPRSPRDPGLRRSWARGLGLFRPQASVRPVDLGGSAALWKTPPRTLELSGLLGRPSGTCLATEAGPHDARQRPLHRRTYPSPRAGPTSDQRAYPASCIRYNRCATAPSVARPVATMSGFRMCVWCCAMATVMCAMGARATGTASARARGRGAGSPVKRRAPGGARLRARHAQSITLSGMSCM